ncbi:MAG: Arsenate reductase [Ignavibacteria bacterium]|nr:MAG: Arsenate reductase [Ignavibacteria bacterium]
MKNGGHFCVSDVVIKGELPVSLKKFAEMYAGCVAGAVQQDEYLDVIKSNGFTNVEIKKTKVISLPDEVLEQYLSKEEISAFREMKTDIFSITVVAEKKRKDTEMTAAAKTKKILILCTGNSCRSQMAEGFLKSFDWELEVNSAGTKPATQVHPKAVQVMSEIGIDLSENYPKMVDEFLNQGFDYVITVCGNAKENCPVFIGKVGKQLHIGFEDPAEAVGTEEEILEEFRRIRDQIKNEFFNFYKGII